MGVFVTKSSDPFEQEKEVHRETVRRLNAEIIRLKIKCGEAFTDAEVIDGFGDPPTIIMSERMAEKLRQRRAVAEGHAPNSNQPEESA